MNTIHHCTALATAIALAISTSAQADTAKTLDTITVTAHRSKVAADKALAAVTVITRDVIEASQAPDLIDLLGRQAGIDIARTGGPGQASTVFLRGGNANHSLVLIDGLRVNSASQGVFDFAHLPLARIERIEIVRGPRAALWGSDAIGGVIHIFTRDPSEASAELRAGSYGRYGADANLGHGDASHGFGVGVGVERVRGFSATNADAGPWSFHPDADGYRNRSLNLRARTSLGGQALAFSGLTTDADVEFDQGTTAARNSSLGAVLAGTLGPGWQHSVSLGHIREDLDTASAFYGNTVASRRSSLDWLLTRDVAGLGTLNVGINGQRESTLSRSEGSGVVFDRARSNRAGFLSWHGQQAVFDYELALRHDDNSQFGGAGTGQAALGWQANDTLRLRGSWGEGFRAPNFNELYYPGFGGWYSGNPDLQPERSRSRELGVDWTPSASHRIGVSLYRTRVAQLIAFAGVRSQAINIANAELDGVELAHHWLHGGFALHSQASWQTAINADTGADLLRRAKRKLAVAADYRFDGGLTLGLDALAVSRRADFGGDLPGFARFDLRIARPLGSDWSLEARIENLFDTHYHWAHGYNTPDRSALLRLRWQPTR